MSKKADFYINEDGNTVFTEEFHLRRGYCCESGCLHCPFGFGEGEEDRDSAEIPHELRRLDASPEISDEDLAELYLSDLDDDQ